MPFSLWFTWSKEGFVFLVASGIVSGVLFTCLGIAISPEGKSKGFEEWKRTVKEYDHGRSRDKKPSWRDVA